MPDNPCIDCLVRAVCRTACAEKQEQIDWINSRFYGAQLNSFGKRRKNADVIIKLREQNRKFDRSNPAYIHPSYYK